MACYKNFIEEFKNRFIFDLNMIDRRHFDKQDELLIDFADFLYNGNLVDMRRDIEDYFSFNFKRIDRKLGKRMKEDIRRIRRICVYREIDEFII